MKRASFLIAALALCAGLAAAQSETSQSAGGSSAQSSQVGRPTAREDAGVRTDYGQDRRVKRGTDQTYNTGATGASVGKDQPATVTGADPQAATTAGHRSDHAARGTGVATGFVAAGIGLAILGLFARRRGRHDVDDIDRDDDDYYGGAGTQTRM